MGFEEVTLLLLISALTFTHTFSLSLSLSLFARFDHTQITDNNVSSS